jgi:hypothetical protein
VPWSSPSPKSITSPRKVSLRMEPRELKGFTELKETKKLNEPKELREL